MTKIEALISIAIVLIIVAAVGGAVVSVVGGAMPHYSDGDRSGTVVKLSRKGLLFKSWEGQMTLGGIGRDSEGNLTSNTWEFSVTDESLVSPLQKAADSGQRVTLTYHQYWIKPMKISTEYVVTGVK